MITIYIIIICLCVISLILVIVWLYHNKHIKKRHKFLPAYAYTPSNRYLPPPPSQVPEQVLLADNNRYCVGDQFKWAVNWDEICTVTKIDNHLISFTFSDTGDYEYTVSIGAFNQAFNNCRFVDKELITPNKIIGKHKFI